MMPSVEIIDEVIATLFRESDPFRVYWSALDNQEKTVYIGKAFSFYLSIPLTGGGARTDELVDKAIAYLSVGFMNEELKSARVVQQNTLESLGAMQNMKFNRRFSAEMPTDNEKKGIEGTFPSKRAYELLKPYMYGFFRMR